MSPRDGHQLTGRDLALLAHPAITPEQAAAARRTIARHAQRAADFVELTRALGLAHDPTREDRT